MSDYFMDGLNTKGYYERTKLLNGTLLKLFLSILTVFLFMQLFVTTSAALTCADCHQNPPQNYVTEIASGNTIHSGVDKCVLCHSGYTASYPHPTFKVTESRCRICHGEGSNLNESHGNKYGGSNYADCTKCHFPNTTRIFELNSSLYKHSHNLTVEYNFYNYNLYGIPVTANNGAGKGVFPYYTCTLTCHNGTGGGQPKIENQVIGWNESKHAQSRVGNETSDSNQYCAKCKSPTQYSTIPNSSNKSSYPIAESAWQGIQCRICHDLHNDTYSGNTPLAFYNATLSYQTGKPVYDKVADATELCEKCHSSTNGRVYGGSHETKLGFTCSNCHMNSTINNMTHNFEVKNTFTGVSGCELCHNPSNHTWQLTSKHESTVRCVACHDQTIGRNASGYAVSSDNKSYGIYNNSGNWTTYKNSYGSPVKWDLHNLTKDVNCDKCHNTTSVYSGLIVRALECADCHAEYGNAVNKTKHNLTSDPSACTKCHAGYISSNQHLTGNRSFVVNESNTCRNSGCHEQNVNGFYERHSSTSDCTTCHLGNTSRRFSLNTSLYTHDHNLTVEHSYYEYNQSGLGLSLNGVMGLSPFPTFTCTTPSCHGKSGHTNVEEPASTWLESNHVRSLRFPAANDNKNNCAKCKSPRNYNENLKGTNPIISAADWKGIQCSVCHNLHKRNESNVIGYNFSGPLAFYNATSSSLLGRMVYDPVHNVTDLCEKCHQSKNSRVYGGIHETMLNYTCANCHINSTINNMNHSFEVKNITTGVSGCEVCHNPSNHTWQLTSKHSNSVRCVACHDQTVGRNASGYAVSSDNISYGIYNYSGNWTTYKNSYGSAVKWDLHNLTQDVNCNKCHNATSIYSGLIVRALVCTDCHSEYASAINTTKHNLATDPSACTKCHAGYEPNNNHVTGNRGVIVNESNTCRNSGCHVEGANINESHGNKVPNPADCTQCHMANTTQKFSLNNSLFTHDHNLKIEYNLYNYSLYGMPLESNNGTGIGMFPYYTCTRSCHDGVGQPKIENEAISWNESAHANSRRGTGDQNSYCAKCKSPTNFNLSATRTNNQVITAEKWNGIQCNICHDLHNDTYSGNNEPAFPLAFYNATLSYQAGKPVYDRVADSTELCEKCHSSSNGRVYGGSHETKLGFTCSTCHMNSTISSMTHNFEVKNTTTGVSGCELCHSPVNHTWQFTSGHNKNVTCVACHDQTVGRNASGYAVSSDNKSYGIYKDPTTNNWTTYKNSYGAAVKWDLHNLTKDVDCKKCHGARSVYSGGIAFGFGGDVTYTSKTTEPLISGYNLIAIALIPDPVTRAKDLLYTSSGGIPGVTKIMRWDSANQTWESFQYIVPASGTGFFSGNNFTMDGYKAYFIKGNASTSGKNYTFVGIK